MILSALLLELAAGGAQPAASPRLDLRGLDPCAKGSTDEVVVCGSRTARSPYRLPRLDDDKYARKPLHPENIVPRGQIHADSSARPDGLVDKRIVITFTVPF